MARCRTAGLLILKDGKIALERYGTSSSPERRWQSYSAAKSITSTLVGAALHDGAIGSLDDRCDLYLPRVRGSAYEGITLRNAMADVLGRGLERERRRALRRPQYASAPMPAGPRSSGRSSRPMAGPWQPRPARQAGSPRWSNS